MSDRPELRPVRSGDDGPPRRGGYTVDRQPPRWPWLIAAIVALYPFYWWFIKRVEVDTNQLLVLVNKTGTELPGEFGDQAILYPELVKSIAAKTGKSPEKVREGYKGIRHEVLTEGRHFFSPIFHERIKLRTTQIPEGKFGVLIRHYGRPLKPGHVVATAPDERGPVSGTLSPGRHNINTFAYSVQVFDKILVPEGFCGVVTRLSGPDPANPDEYVVQQGERGVQPESLGPGTYLDLNPYEVRVDLVDLRSQKYDMLGDEAIEFPSNDGFTIHMEATVEWSVYPDLVPFVVVEVGDLEDVVGKVIRPYTTSLARIQGSKMTARDFMGAREVFQRRLFTDLRDKCREQGVLIKAATIRDLKPPERVRAIIRERELADQTMTKYENEIAEAQVRAQLVEQEMLATQQQAIGETNREVVAVVTRAQQTMDVAVTEATQRLEVARLELESARRNAEAILARGQAEAAVILLNYRAEAEPLKNMVTAFGDGDTYARNQFLQKVAPSIRSVLATTDGPFADIFRQFQVSTPAGRRPVTPAESPDVAKTAPGSKP